MTAAADPVFRVEPCGCHVDVRTDLVTAFCSSHRRAGRMTAAADPVFRVEPCGCHVDVRTDLVTAFCSSHRRAVELVGRPARVGEVCECGRLALVVVGVLPWCGGHVIVGRPDA